MDILKIATAGSVDDGKSTLIGRLLYETKSITKDKIEALEIASKRKGLDFVDLSLLTDGLIAEREQGITIDVAHIYFNSPNRKYIIADTPGHFEYTRNMVTGASNAAVSVILVDARNGVSEQTKRHFYIASLLRVKEVIVAINKMDLVDYGEERFKEIQAEFLSTVGEANFIEQRITFIPLSSLYGENIVEVSPKMPWYKGQSLLQHLESIELDKVSHNSSELPARFAVQYVIRPKTEEFHDYRGYAGRLASGELSVGDLIQVHPSGQVSNIKTIEKFGKQLEHAKAGDSVTLTLETDIDVSRGNMLTKAAEAVEPQKALKARICWLDNQPLTAGKTYLLQHGVNLQKAKVTALNSVMNIETMQPEETRNELKLNEIGYVEVKTAQPLFTDTYESNPGNGSFILIDSMTNSTVGVGFVY
jgi:sulfate adenylyltransferase subunit 1